MTLQQVLASLRGARRERRLAILAIALGALAVAGDPYGGGAVSLEPRELARRVQTGAGHLSVEELAGWIVAGRADFRLLDLRDEGSYIAYHIPGAERAALTDLVNEPPERGERLVLYADGAVQAAQAWLLLAAQGHRAAYLLDGGLAAWKDRILFPVLPQGASPVVLAAARRAAEVAAFFGGSPRSGADAAAAAPAAPAPLPAVAAAAPSAKTGKKKKEGC